MRWGLVVTVFSGMAAGVFAALLAGAPTWAVMLAAPVFALLSGIYHQVEQIRRHLGIRDDG